MEPVISVIIPTLNEEIALPNLLQDLVLQTDDRFEVIIVDGNSSDKTHEKATTFDKKLLSNFIIAPKAHLATQRNLGAKNAKTNYLFFVDADSRLAPDVIKTLLFHIEKEKGLLYLPHIAPSTPTMMNRFLVSLTINSVKTLQRIGKALSIGPLIVIEKHLFDRIGGFSEVTTASEDHNLVIKAHQAGVKAVFLDDVHCIFSMRRFDKHGTWSILWQYTVFTAETLFKGAVYNKVDYEMGGQKYVKDKS
jgi:glycosyltransferase involved in cell wall biosynthesis